jgi:peroxiredoxin
VGVDEGLLEGITARAVFVINRHGTLVCAGIIREPGVLPDLDAIRTAVESAETVE